HGDVLVGQREAGAVGVIAKVARRRHRAQPLANIPLRGGRTGSELLRCQRPRTCERLPQPEPVAGQREHDAAGSAEIAEQLLTERSDLRLVDGHGRILLRECPRIRRARESTGSTPLDTPSRAGATAAAVAMDGPGW